MFPLGTLESYFLNNPSTFRSSKGTMTFHVHGVPDVCWQSEQWHKAYSGVDVDLRRQKNNPYLSFDLVSVRDFHGSSTTEACRIKGNTIRFIDDGFTVRFIDNGFTVRSNGNGVKVHRLDETGIGFEISRTSLTPFIQSQIAPKLRRPYSVTDKGSQAREGGLTKSLG